MSSAGGGGGVAVPLSSVVPGGVQPPWRGSVMVAVVAMTGWGDAERGGVAEEKGRASSKSSSVPTAWSEWFSEGQGGGGRVGGEAEDDDEEEEEEEKEEVKKPGGASSSPFLSRYIWTSSAVSGLNLLPRLRLAHLIATSSGASRSPPKLRRSCFSVLRTSS